MLRVVPGNEKSLFPTKKRNIDIQSSASVGTGILSVTDVSGYLFHFHF